MKDEDDENIINLPDIGPMVWHEDMQDPEGLLNVRNFIEDILVRHPNIEATDAGIGIDGADLGLLIEGHPFMLKIKPRLPSDDQTEE